jgi:hypothetical protein
MHSMEEVEMNDEARAHGALTGESGTLTPPHVEEEFVPAERRMMEQTSHEADGTEDRAPQPAQDDASSVGGATPPNAATASEERIDPQQDRF